jgi:putative tricarboxylic transport membrane protein
VLCIIGSYSLGLNIFNLYLMLPVGIISYFLIQMGYPIAPLVIGVILGPMADENLRRALMVSQGSFMPVFTRPVALVLFLIIVWTVISQFEWYRKTKNWILDRLLPGRRGGPAAPGDADE